MVKFACPWISISSPGFGNETSAPEQISWNGPRTGCRTVRPSNGVGMCCGSLMCETVSRASSHRQASAQFLTIGHAKNEPEWRFPLGPPNSSQIGSTKTGCVHFLSESPPNFSQHPALLLTDSRPLSHRTRPTFSHSAGISVFDQRFTGSLKLNPKQNYFYPQRACFNSFNFTAPF
jgi:hypothetical protein